MRRSKMIEIRYGFFIVAFALQVLASEVALNGGAELGDLTWWIYTVGIGISALFGLHLGIINKKEE
jgi:hypothetical protein